MPNERCAWIYGDSYLTSKALASLKNAIGESPEGFTVHGDDIEALNLKGAMLSQPFDHDHIKLIVIKESRRITAILPRSLIKFLKPII
jgi:hypothetical protein